MMQKRISLRLLLLPLIIFITALTARAVTPGDSHDGTSGIPAPPKTTVNEVKEIFHGTEIVDPYRWLEDQNSPETRAWIDAQNAYTDSLISKYPGHEALRQQVSALIKIDTMSAPLVRGNRYFFGKRSAVQYQS